MGSKHNKAFGEELRFRRDEHGLSQEEVAWRAHLSRQYVSRLELGECSPSLDTMVAVAAALGTTLDVMIYGVSGVSSRNGKNRTLSRSPPVFSRHPPFTAFCLAFLDDDGTNGYDHLLVIERGIPACRLEQFPPFR